MAWVLFTLMAAFMQSWRNALQSRLSSEVNALGVTLARFLFAAPLAALYLGGLYAWQSQPIPEFNAQFAGFVIGASLMQIVATALMVRLFQLRDFAIGAGLAKSEALLAALFGVWFFGTTLSAWGWVGIAIGTLAVFLLSCKQGIRSLSWPTIILGLASGGSFALTSLWIREASLSLDLVFPHRAGWVLLWVLLLQTLLLLIWMGWRDRTSLRQLLQRWRLTGAISLCGCVASIGWFSAMSLQNVPFVKTLGQIEVLFTLAVAHFWLRQKLRWQDVAGLLLIGVAAAIVILL